MEKFAAGRGWGWGRHSTWMPDLDKLLPRLLDWQPASEAPSGRESVGGVALGWNQKLAKLSAYPLCPSDSSVKIVNLARILLNEGIFFRQQLFGCAEGHCFFGCFCCQTYAKQIGKGQLTLPHTHPERHKKKKEEFSSTKWKFFNCIFANCRSGLLASNSFQWKLQRKIFSHRQHKSCIRLRATPFIPYPYGGPPSWRGKNCKT